MHKALWVGAAALFLAGPALAATEGETLMKTKGCVACHAVDKKLVGPAYKDVAKKYTEADVPKLVEKVKKGGVGVWGQVPMPPNAQVADEDIEKIVRWILTLK
ncbi:c-type cytochrome [Tepidiphilus thermophilus]|uniref:Cytochrome c551/c552 n=1 Tax=Tepidiphilus thermophilus TaxID=876478 RepID=A0A0K6IRU4_9PROT|nr:c-type cytochrome [Tepidiphilus thermophilus]CUB05813.1 Cytochrome c551/c552 [Tepidiphilus thermophilus]